MRLQPLAELFPDQFKAEEPLAKLTVARLGGPAEGVLRVRDDSALQTALRWVTEHDIPWRILGGGANVLASDDGFRGLVIVNQMREVQIDAASGRVMAQSGANLATLARRCMAKGLKGLEWCVSVPGTVGGAVVNNAGAHGGDMAHDLVECAVLDIAADFQRLTWAVDQLDYGYRHSRLKGQHGRYIVLSAVLQTDPGHDPTDLNAIADGFIAHRKSTQPPGASLGSMFKNPPGDYAGRLIEAAGLKGHQIGGVQISPVHANFFVNTGAGTAEDYRALIELAQAEVLAQFGVSLELEVERVGDWMV